MRRTSGWIEAERVESEGLVESNRFPGISAMIPTEAEFAPARFVCGLKGMGLMIDRVVSGQTTVTLPAVYVNQSG